MTENKRIFLSPPHMGGDELQLFEKAFQSNWIAPVGPDITKFEKEFAEEVGARYAAAVSSGTAALHLCLRYVGVSAGDEVLCSTFTFVATGNAILYLDAVPVFVDAEAQTWNMDPGLLRETLQKMDRKKCLPKAVLLVHLYGQPADIDSIVAICDTFQVPLIEDAAEALGAEYHGATPGTFGEAGIYSFNGNKIITTSGGGMIVSNNKKLIEKVKFWATQAREPELHYQHEELGYNYRMSNLLAAIGRGQLKVLDQRVASKKAIYSYYKDSLSDLPGVQFVDEPPWGKSTRWLSCLLVDSAVAGVDNNTIIKELEDQNIEARPVWKPLHLQPLFKGSQVVNKGVSEEIFQQGVCLPSGTAMEASDLQRIVKIVRGCWKIS